jgi:hypothetical protein
MLMRNAHQAIQLTTAGVQYSQSNFITAYTEPIPSLVATAPVAVPLSATSIALSWIPVNSAGAMSTSHFLLHLLVLLCCSGHHGL